MPETSEKEKKHVVGPYGHSKEDEKRIADLFKRLDRNKDGRIDVHELREGIERMGLPSMSGTAQVGRISSEYDSPCSCSAWMGII